MAIEPSQRRVSISKPEKRIRWATQRVSSISAKGKRSGIAHRFQKNNGNEKKRESGGSGGSDSLKDSQQGGRDGEGEDGTADGRRRIFFNVPLPDDAKDEDGQPLARFNRNKIRTARYTPLSFIPKNLWFQFQNIANVYFGFMVILSFFSIFGASSPGLAAAPLLFILFVTAVKDAIEDWRRTGLDTELNNSPVHKLIHWNNVNSSEDNISLWRRLKKLSSHGIIKLFRLWQNRKQKNDGDTKDLDGTTSAEPRVSVETRQTIRDSMATHRTSFYSLASPTREEGIQMTPVPSPSPRRNHDEGSDAASRRRSGTEFPFQQSQADEIGGDAAGGQTEGPNNLNPQVRFYGDLKNPFKQTPGKAIFKRDQWKNVQVGDFVRIFNNDQIPADIAVLSTSDPDGACYVETKNLDGETNLKVRHALQSGRKVRHAKDCEKADFILESEPPHSNLYQYSGIISWTQRNARDEQEPGKEMKEPVSINNLLLRGCNLRNTDWVLGIVVFTGQETKIMLNSGVTPTKRSRITRDLNWNVMYNFVVLLVMCIVSGVVNGVTWGQGGQSFTYFEFGSIGGGNSSLDGFITFWSALILFQNLVPISLYISIEIIKLFQAFFIYSDTYIYYEKIDYPCTPKSWNISDDLGQIEYIFSDKTGTLTQNVMEFKKCSINGSPYGEAYTEAQAGMQKRQGIDTEAEAAKANKQIAEDRARMIEHLRRIHDNPYLHDEDLTFVAPDFVQDLEGANGDERQLANKNFMIALALCHTVITERTAGDPPTLEFKAQSPDEAALVATARDCGFTVIGRSNTGIILNIQGKEQEYQVLNTLEFNSSRKRMSAIIRMPDKRIILFCKGADSIIYSRLKKGQQHQLKKETAEHLEMFAREGLRTLCIAQKELSEEVYQAWSRQHDIAASTLEDREGKLDMISDAIERDLILLGGTAIEDKLQGGVPDTITLLARAGIKLWVLTGDKVETAINIGFSCNLLDNGMDLIVFKTDDESLENTEAELDKHLATFNMTGSDEELQTAKKDHEPPKPTHAIIIDGDALKLVLKDELRQKFLLLCKQCRSVLCCRVSPSQKAQVVQMVKQGLDVMTLSIGDGANDVAMIQEADIGVGIAGEEGRQAVMSSDYAIGQFRFLQRLVLVHGRWSYRRLAEAVANFFYKNMVWTVCLFWYQLYNNFDSSYLFDYSYILLYNTAFTSLPVIVMGILDQDVSDKVSLAVPQLYRRGIERKDWTQTKFWLYMVDGIYQSLICYYMVYLLYAPGGFITANGLDVGDRYRFGVYIGNATIIVVNVYVLLNLYRWDWLMLLLVGLCTLLIWFWTGVYSSFTSSLYFYKSANQCYSQLSFWMVSLLLVIISLIPRFTAKAFQKIFMPRDIDIIREQVRLGKFRYLDDLAPDASPSKIASAAISDTPNGKAVNGNASRDHDDETRPIYPPSVAATATTHNRGSNNGSDGTNYTGRRTSSEQIPDRAMSTVEPGSRPLSPIGPLSVDRPRPSFDRMRSSLDIVRPSFEASQDFTSASRLMRVESSHSDYPSQRKPPGASNLQRYATTDLS